jgi:hypothetical protein
MVFGGEVTEIDGDDDGTGDDDLDLLGGDSDDINLPRGIKTGIFVEVWKELLYRLCFAFIPIPFFIQ